MRRPLTSVIATFLMLGGCSGDTQSAVEHLRIGDTLSVVNHAPVHADTVHLELMQVYGAFASHDGALDAELATPVAFDVDEDGSVYVYESSQGIKSFASTGEFSGWIAREGQGPREVQYTIQLAASKDGRVAAYDLGNGRVTVFRRDGTVVTQARRPDGMPPYAEDGLQWDEQDRLWVGLNPPYPLDGGIRFPRAAYVRLLGDGTYADTIFVPARFTELCPTMSEGRFRMGFWEDRREPFVPKVKWSWNGQHMAIGCPEDYNFDLRQSDGEVLRVSRPWSAVELTSDQRSLYGNGFAAPAQRPAYARLILTTDGRVWVWPEQEMEEFEVAPSVAQMTGRRTSWKFGESGAFDLFDSSGRWLGQIEMPEEVQYSGYPTSRRVVIRGDSIWAVARDSLGVPYIHKYRIAWPEDEPQ